MAAASKAAGHMASAATEHREMSAGAQSLLSFVLRPGPQSMAWQPRSQGRSRNVHTVTPDSNLSPE